MKKCSKCKKEKPLSEFNKNKNHLTGHHHYCKDCLHALKKKNYNYEKSKKYFIRHKYNLNIEEVQKLYTEQHGKCLICKDYKDKVSVHNGLYIDHDHITGKVRGLLCRRCNHVLGIIEDNPLILKNAIEYLENCHKML